MALSVMPVAVTTFALFHAALANTPTTPPDDTDSHLILLNAGTIDTRLTAAESVATNTPDKGKSLRLIQFSDAIRPDWYDQLTATGVHIVSYVANNAYLVYGDSSQLASLRDLAHTGPLVQWTGPYLDQHKIDPAVAAILAQPQAASEQFAIQLVDDPIANVESLALIDQRKTAPIVRQFKMLGYLNIVVRLPASAIAPLAARPDVVSIQQYQTPRLWCERQAQIVASNLSGNIPVGPGYLGWITSKGFTQTQFSNSGFVVDVSDSGIDNGTTAPNHFGLYVEGLLPGVSRVAYNRLVGTPHSNSTISGCDGHGNINAHIIAGHDNLPGFPFADADGFHFGLGICPWVRVGSSVVFDPNSFTSPNYTTLQSQAYADGARISSNSWGSSTTSYTVDSQTYDALVRDAQPSAAPFPAAGNQEMVIIFANGNSGPGASTTGNPANAKNVISVGAAENVQPIGGPNFHCNTVTDADANSADDMARFSSRGPTADARRKPDLVAPGTNVSGGVAQTTTPGPTGTADPCFNGTGVCGGLNSNFFPSAGQQFYTSSSGTSHSTPCVAGGAALLRQFFLNQGLVPPSAAMTKALLMNSARYLTGSGANDDLWSNSQGMGEMDLSELFNRTPSTTILRDQLAADMFTATGQTRLFSAGIADLSKPFRVTLAWTDPPGPTFGAAYKNNLDLTVTVAGVNYRGNVFNGRYSAPGGTADPRNNVESVFLPPGTGGAFTVTVTAANINSDGVPNVGGSLDQDFALVIHNITLDCNSNGTLDSADIAGGASRDCNTNNLPDECELVINDCNSNGTPDNCEGTDCNTNSVRDFCELAGRDCNTDGTLDVCQFSTDDCNGNGTHDACEDPAGDCNSDGIPDTCQPDCDTNGIIDACEGSSDCNTNGTPDRCDLLGRPGNLLLVSGPVNLAIPDNNFTGVSHALTNTIAGVVQDVNVTVHIQHPAVGQLSLALIHAGRTVTLFSARCGAVPNLDITFDDAGATLNCTNLAGTYRPNSAGGASLSAFNGLAADGPWTLRVLDITSGSTGTLTTWTLNVVIPDTPPASHDQNGNGTPDECEGCPSCLGDMNGDGGVNGGDIQGFVAAFIGGTNAACADMDSSGAVNSNDLNLFVNFLLSAQQPCP